jgi:hypothetical protein
LYCEDVVERHSQHSRSAEAQKIPAPWFEVRITEVFGDLSGESDHFLSGLAVGFLAV